MPGSGGPQASVAITEDESAARAAEEAAARAETDRRAREEAERKEKERKRGDGPHDSLREDAASF